METTDAKVKDVCIICSEATNYNKEENINNRFYYVEGAGQLCSKCYVEIYG